MRLSSLKIWLVAVLLVTLASNIFAQANVDSPYSIFGIGQVRDKSMNVQLGGMGGTANAIYSGGMINVANPASYARIDSLAFLFDVGMYFKSSSFSNSFMSEDSRNASFDYLAMAFGLTSWWKVALGAQPYSTVGYNMIVDKPIEQPGHYTSSFSGKGGLNQAFVGNAFKLGKHFSIGANVNYVFGDTETLTTLYFPDSTYFISSRRGIDNMVRSFMFDYGFLFTGKLSSDLHLNVGLTYAQKVRLSNAQTIFIRSVEGDATQEIEYVIDTIYYNVNNNSKITMPQGFGIGVALQKDNRWTLGADFNWTQWSKFAREGINDPLQDSWSVSLGGEYMPVATSISSYFKRMTYRMGAFYEHTYLNVNGNSINKMGISIGTSLPLPRTMSKVNLAVELGQCGTKANNLIQERYINLRVGIAVHEMWFIKRKYK